LFPAQKQKRDVQDNELETNKQIGLETAGNSKCCINRCSYRRLVRTV
jgi:hypothetical protein